MRKCWVEQVKHFWPVPDALMAVVATVRVLCTADSKGSLRVRKFLITWMRWGQQSLRKKNLGSFSFPIELGRLIFLFKLDGEGR